MPSSSSSISTSPPLDPYTLIPILQSKIKQQQQTLFQYKKIFECVQNQKNIIYTELKKKTNLLQKYKQKLIESEENIKEISKFKGSSIDSIGEDKSIYANGKNDRYTNNNNNKLQNQSSHTKSRIQLNPNLLLPPPPNLSRTLSQKSNKNIIYTPTGLKLVQQSSIFSKSNRNSITSTNNINSHNFINSINSINPYNSNNVQYQNNINNNQNNDFIPFDISLTNNSNKGYNKNYSIYNHNNNIKSIYSSNNNNNNNNLTLSNSINLNNNNNNNNYFTTTGQSFYNNTFNNANNNFMTLLQYPAEHFIQDFVIISPDPSELKKKRDLSKKSTQLILNPTTLYHENTQISQYVLKQISTRCFPMKINAKKVMVEKYQQLKQIIQYKPSNKLSQQYFVITIRKQQQQQKNVNMNLPTHTNTNNYNNPNSNSTQKTQFYTQSNLNQYLYIFILKQPQFILIQKDQKHYQRKQQQIWMIQKCYAIVTYYPYFDIFVNMMNKIEDIIRREKLVKIHNDKQKYYGCDLRWNVMEVEKNGQIQEIIKYFRTKKIDFNDTIMYKSTYFGKTPSPGLPTTHYLTYLLAPIFLSCFSYQQFLLLLTVILTQRTLIILSTSQSLSTFCSLFLTSIIHPFPLQFLLLNTDQSKISQMVFDFPFPIIASIKRSSVNLDTILYDYISMQISKKQIKKENQRIVMVDIDSRTVFYNNHRNLDSLVYNVSEQLMYQYSLFNNSYSKSFSFPKKLMKQNEQPKQNKKKQQIKKTFKQMSQKIQTNQTKHLTFQPHPQVTKIISMFIQYIHSFIITGEPLQQALKYHQQRSKDNKMSHHYNYNYNQYNNSNGSNNNIKRTYQEVLKEYLMKKHPEKGQLVEVLVNSQYYANYLAMEKEKENFR